MVLLLPDCKLGHVGVNLALHWWRRSGKPWVLQVLKLSKWLLHTLASPVVLRSLLRCVYSKEWGKFAYWSSPSAQWPWLVLDHWGRSRLAYERWWVTKEAVPKERAILLLLLFGLHALDHVLHLLNFSLHLLDLSIFAVTFSIERWALLIELNSIYVQTLYLALPLDVLVA